MFCHGFFKLVYWQLVFVLLFWCYWLRLCSSLSKWGFRLIGIYAKLLSSYSWCRIDHTIAPITHYFSFESLSFPWWKFIFSQLFEIIYHYFIIFVWTFLNKIFDFFIIQIFHIIDVDWWHACHIWFLWKRYSFIFESFIWRFCQKFAGKSLILINRVITYSMIEIYHISGGPIFDRFLKLIFNTYTILSLRHALTKKFIGGLLLALFIWTHWQGCQVFLSLL